MSKENGGCCSSVNICPQDVDVKLAPTPVNDPLFPQTVKNAAGAEVLVADPRASRALVGIMNAHAVIGGAAAHWGGPAALAEIMSAAHYFMFADKSRPWHDNFNFVNDAGHCENGVYAIRATYGFDSMTIDDLWGFRGIHSKLSGHGEQHLNPEGVLFSNGPLGSGLATAQGIAMADKMSGKERTTMCIITDGASMEGEAREAFASIPGVAAKGQLNPFVMIVSDNDTKLTGRIDEDSFSMQPTFEALETLGWNLIKVEAGNDLQTVFSAVENAFEVAKANPEKPVAIWAKTVKGFGIKATEEARGGGHGFPGSAGAEMQKFVSELFAGEDVPANILEWAEDVEKIVAEKAEAKKAAPAPSSDVVIEKIQAGYFRAMDRLVKEGLPVVSVTSDLPGSTGIGKFQTTYPERSFDMGVAEANMVSVAAGLSKAGYIPVIDTFAQFGITKGNMPLIMSSLSQCPLVALFSHNGLQDAADGASHQAIGSFATTSTIPGFDIVCCSSSADGEAYLEQALRRIYDARKNGEAPRSTIIYMGREDFPAHSKEGLDYSWGKAQVIREASSEKSVVLAAAGYPVHKAVKAAEILAAKGIDATVVQSAFVNHPDVATISPLVNQAGGRMVTIEDNVIFGGAGAQLCHALLQNGDSLQVKSIGIRDAFGRSAYLADQLYQKNGMDVADIVSAAEALCE